MYRYAQTNVQLYDQLCDDGYSASDLKRIRAAYDLMCQLCSAQFRPNGKPVIAHLVGVASVLAAHGARLPVILAGLSHAAYAKGDFGGFWPPMTWPKSKRRLVAGVIGEDAEALVARYTESEWSNEKVAEWVGSLPENAERQLLFIRFANELEEAADRSILCGAPAEQQQRIERLHACIELARRLDFGPLAGELQAAHDHVRNVRSIYTNLVNCHVGDYTAAPLSYRRRLIPALSHGLKVLWSKLPKEFRSHCRNWTFAWALRH